MKSKQNVFQPDYDSWHQIIENHGKRLGDKIFIESLDQDRNISYDQMNNWTSRIANYLKSRNLGKNDKVALIGDNSLESMIIYFGILKYGSILVPVFSEESEENLYRILDLCQPSIVLYDSDLNLDRKKRPRREWVSFSEFYKNPSTNCELSRELKDQPQEFKEQLGDKQDIAEIIYTSGTTELPKGILISREALFYMVDEISDRSGITEKDRVLEYRDYNWASTQLLTILTSMMKGSSLYLAKKFSRSRFPDWLKNNNITVASGVPAVLNMLINKPVPLNQNELPFLRYITSSSAPLPVETQFKFERMYGIVIIQGMGMSELGWMVLNPPTKRKTGSVGLPLKYKEISFVKSDGSECKPCEIGEMRVKGKTMGLSYLNGDGSIDEFSRDGFATGDLGYMDEEGYIFITGRKKELIIRGGVNISPMEITSCLLKHPAVNEAATLGIPDEIYGESVVSFVSKKEGSKVDVDGIIEHCKDILPDFKIPKSVIFVSEIPKTRVGKVAKKDLLKLYEEKK